MLEKLLDSTTEAARLRALVDQLGEKNQDHLQEITRLRQENARLRTDRDQWRLRADANDKEMSEIEVGLFES